MPKFEDYLAKTSEVGFVDQVSRAVIYVSGLPGARIGELVEFEEGGRGQVISLRAEMVEVLAVSHHLPKVGIRVARTGEFLEAPVGDELLSRTIDPLGNPLDQKEPLSKKMPRRPLEVVPSGIDKRRKTVAPLETGVAIVDLMLPLGKGQRELVIGDRKTGKTSFLLQTILTQARQGTICVYAAIGKKQGDIKGLGEFFAKNGVADKVIIVASGSQDPAGLIFLAPYTAITVAEYFRDQGKDTLVVLDDLTTHAKFYREIALLARRFPGRDSYPGDIFYTHSRLLERAGNFALENGKEAAITCLPVAESLESDLTGYIQTNLMSMTDGHIFFDTDLFDKGHRPAVNPFLSVTRVGRQTQDKLRQDINREVTTLLALYQKSEGYSHFGAGLSEGMKLTLATGQSVWTFFNHGVETNIPLPAQVILFSFLWVGFWKTRGDDKMKEDVKKLAQSYKTDKKAQEYFDKLLDGPKSFNDLLAVIQQKQDEFAEEFNL